MSTKIEVKRIVVNIYSDDLERTKAFYTDFLGLELVMDMDWIITFASRENSSAQISILRNESKKQLSNEGLFLSVEVSDVDALYKTAQEKSIEITYPLTNESWGVRRFFVKDPNGATLNLLQHLS